MDLSINAVRSSDNVQRSLNVQTAFISGLPTRDETVKTTQNSKNMTT